MGNILIDENYLNSIIFKEETAFHIDGFRGPFAKQAKNMLEIKTVRNKIQIVYPNPIKKVLAVIEDSDMIKTRDLSKNSGIGGGKLKEILNFLVREGVIKEYISNEGVGRPGKYYSTVE
jgi:response regulator of citrate/malate metabolism